MSANVKPVRRIVVIDENDKSKAIADGPVSDVRTDPARPGFTSTHLWVTDRTPARIKGVRELRPKALAAFKALVEFREEEARRRDMPPFKILPNHVLLECAAHAPADIRAHKEVVSAYLGA